MALIAVAVYDTEENGRTELTQQTLKCLAETVDLDRHRIILVDNASCESTKEILLDFSAKVLLRDRSDNCLITNSENVGTAKAINQAWKHRKPGEYLIKMDNDVVINSYDWVDELEEAMSRDPRLGILGLKRKDLIEDPNRVKNDDYKSRLKALPHKTGERWINIEVVEGVMGTCQMYRPELIDKIGGLYQMDGLYGFDDTLAAIRCKLAGFYNAFLPHIEIDHIDPGDSPYTEWKRKYAGEMMAKFYETKQGLINGTIPVKVEL